MNLDIDSHQYDMSLTLDPSEHAAFEARALVDALPLSLSLEQRYDMRLALSELVANSVVHGSDGTRDPVDIHIRASVWHARCEVSAHGPGFRRPNGQPSPSHGFGLIIVGRLASRWGTHR